ncbi:MAG: hypothetical protein A3F72_18395 [Bacteroidetes bacterium RIFCSPLOWO2_12_FULL_35_15]|nr:MAG: hypothetical protein A3F72_18395 [Bacteroidetes bacterium RIFCSPLOWO2_12_FULL_35_15]
MKTNKSYNTLFSSSGFIVLLFLIFTQFSFAGTDTTKVRDQQYPLNDPRNPNCPCHKLQKQADDEFAQLNKTKDQFGNIENNNKNNVNDKETNEPKLVSEIGERVMRRISTTSITKYKNKKKVIWITKVRFKFAKRAHRIKKTFPDYEICFKW